MFALNTTQVIAASLQIQPSTLIRFAKEFEFAGFSDMQRVFRQRLIEGEATVRDQVLATADSTPTAEGDLDAAHPSAPRKAASNSGRTSWMGSACAIGTDDQ